MSKSKRTRIRRSTQEWRRQLTRFERGELSHRKFCETAELALIERTNVVEKEQRQRNRQAA